MTGTTRQIPFSLPSERTVRLATGLVLMAYATAHFLSHAAGIFLWDALALADRVLLAPWSSRPGQALLYGAFTVHIALGLVALWRRRTLRMSRREALQLALGLAIPLLLIDHAVNVRVGQAAFGASDGYERLVHHYWVAAPLEGLGQFALLALVWVHGCLGLHFWLRHRPWYDPALPALAVVAAMVPVLALVGIANAGWDAQNRVAAGDAAFLAAVASDAAGDHLDRLSALLTGGYLVLVGAVLGARVLRDAVARRVSPVRVNYPDGAVVVVPRGYSVLEASRWAGRKPASMCGGRGRCSTCRVQVQSAAPLPRPSVAEAETLRRIHAPPGLRLACQLRPTGDVSVMPLIRAGEADAFRFSGDDEAAPREMEVTALFCDLRDSTRIASEMLPYDALLVVNRYVELVTAAVGQTGGTVASVAGDGIMAVFGLDGDAREDAREAARSALRAAAAIVEGLRALNQELSDQVPIPLRCGIGIHSGLSVVGLVGVGRHRRVQFIGDVGNVASRLEQVAKERERTTVVSLATFRLAGMPVAAHQIEAVHVRGRTDPVEIACTEVGSHQCT